MARVLVLEDEPNIARIILFKLEREGHQVRLGDATAADVEFAPELALVDADNDHDVAGVVDRLRPLCGVVMLTSARNDQVPAGAVATMRKPFKPTVLARMVRDLTAGGHRLGSDDGRPPKPD